MEILAWVILGFLGMRWGMSMLNVITRPLLPQEDASIEGLVSIMIPVRNEADNLPTLFKQLSGLGTHQLEIIFLNDHSEDDTEALLQNFTTQHPHASYLQGKPLPVGWLGKHWACHQLGQQANGKFFLFLDADIAYLHPRLIPSAKAMMKKHQLTLLSLFPDQIMVDTGEKLVVPIMHYLLLSLLPLWWILRLPFPSMAAANGQFMFFDAETYGKYLWHERVKTNVVEDIAIMQQLKKEKLKGLTLLGNGLIRCRMYKSLREGIDGFSKNILAGFGNSVIGILIYLFLVILGWGFILSALSPLEIWGAILLILSIRVGLSWISHQSVVNNLLFHPVQMGLLVYISIRSIYKKSTKQVEWKGRNIAGK